MRTEDRPKSMPRRLVGRGVGLVRSHPKISAVAAFVGGGLLVFAFLWFEPHKLFIEKTVNEALPGAVATTPAATASPTPSPTATGTATTVTRPPPPAGPVTLSSGPFRRLEHPTSGTASVIRLTDGSHILRLDDLDTSNGPDLRVYLSEVPASDDWFAYGGTGTFIDLGELKGNRGDQNYTIPAGTDLSRFRSAVVWCVRFRVGFGVAPLNRA